MNNKMLLECVKDMDYSSHTFMVQLQFQNNEQ